MDSSSFFPWNYCNLCCFYFRFTSPTSPARKPSSALPLPDSHSMDWNSLVNTATKAINTDEDETTLMDLESEQPTQKSTSRYEMAKKNFYIFHDFTKWSLTIIIFFKIIFQFKRSNTSWRKAKPVTWEIRISGAQIEFRIQAKIRISRWSGSIKGRESKITRGICNSCPATSTIYRMVFPNHWKDLNIVIFFFMRDSFLF